MFIMYIMLLYDEQLYTIFCKENKFYKIFCTEYNLGGWIYG